jgi:cell division protein FtsQ
MGPTPIPGVAIDPRIRARRIEVQRDAGRRRLRRVVDVGLILLVVAGFAGALRSPLLDVGTVDVTGAAHTSDKEIARRSGVRTGEPLMDVDLHAAGVRVGALPWVGRVDLHRRLNGTVAIRVTERTPAAVLGDGADAVVVDATGRVLARASDVPDQAATLVRVLGIHGGLAPGDTVGGQPGAALALAGRLATAVPGAIATVTVGQELVATLAQGGEVRFGDPSRLATKLRSLQTMLDDVDLTCLAVMDLRAPANPVLTRREPCS